MFVSNDISGEKLYRNGTGKSIGATSTISLRITSAEREMSVDTGVDSIEDITGVSRI